MKKALVILAVALIPLLGPVSSWADFQLGGTGMYDGDVTRLGSTPVTGGDFTYALEARYKFFDVLQLGLTGLYYPAPFVGGSSYIVTLTDVGLSLDIFFLRFGAGVGPDFLIPMSGPAVSPTSAVNLKLSGDINLGPVSVGVVAFYPVPSIWDLPYVTHTKPWVGLTAMIRLF